MSFAFLRKTCLVVADAFGHFNKDEGWAIASHVALSTLMALFPFLIFLAALAGFFGSQELAEQAVFLLFENWPETIAAPLAREITTVLTRPRGDLLTLGIGLVIILASNGVEGMRIALNRAYRQVERRSFAFRRIQSILFVIIGALVLISLAFFLVLAPIAWNVAERFIPLITRFAGTFFFWRFFTAILILAFGLFTAHKWLACGRRRFGEIWPGIVFTLILWVLAAIGFSLYLQNFNTYASTYAGLAGAMITIVFFYIIAIIFILGGELNAAMQRIVYA